MQTHQTTVGLEMQCGVKEVNFTNSVPYRTPGVPHHRKIQTLYSAGL